MARSSDRGGSYLSFVLFWCLLIPSFDTAIIEGLRTERLLEDCQFVNFEFGGEILLCFHSAILTFFCTRFFGMTVDPVTCSGL